jgi:hypothetical protein
MFLGVCTRIIRHSLLSYFTSSLVYICMSARKYSKSASKEVEKEMHEMKRGRLKSGRSGKKVTSRRQAIAIGLSEARKKGARVPSPRKVKNGRKNRQKKGT